MLRDDADMEYMNTIANELKDQVSSPIQLICFFGDASRGNLISLVQCEPRSAFMAN